MQTIDCFYYPNTVEVQFNIDPTLTLRNRVMHQRTVKLYKGVDNVVRFAFKNSDQHPVNITGWNVTFNMLSDDESSIVVSKPATVINANLGVVTASITEFDLIDLNNDRYNYSLSITDPFGSEQVVYADDNYDVRGEILLRDGHYPKFRPSINVQLPTNSNSNVITSTVTSDTPTRQQSAHHTAEFYFNNFTGNIAIQATLDSLPPLGNTSANVSLSWATLTNIGYDAQTVPDYENFDGVFTAVRFIVTPANTSPLSGNVTSILYRA